MGMVFGFFYMVYFFTSKVIYKIITRLTDNKWIKKTALAFFILLPTYDIIITNILGAYYCLITPSTYISKKIQYPISIYWEDNVYPGFSKEDRELMIINYLNGKYLKKMALNGDDGKVHVYEAKEGEFKSFRYDSKYKNRDAQYISIIMDNEKIYTKETMPKMNYTVMLNEVKLNLLSRQFLYSDETKIIDNQTNETIAYNRRFKRFFYNAFPDWAVGGRYYSRWDWEIFKTGTYLYYNGDGFGFIGKYGTTKHKVDLNERLYNKYIKGEK